MRKIGITTSLLLVLTFMALTRGPSLAGAQASVTCNLLTPTIVMTEPGAIRGTSGDDVIVGTAGDDIIDAGAGNDTVCGEGGNDVIRTGEGNDQMWGEAFRDDILIGTPGNDVLDSGPGDDLLVDPVGFGQVLRAGDGADRLIGFGTLDGGSGDDNIRVLGGAAGQSTLLGQSGTDTCTPFSGDDILRSCEVLP
jgi:Ca2+-binding RTX toxin-like protein